MRVRPAVDSAGTAGAIRMLSLDRTRELSLRTISKLLKVSNDGSGWKVGSESSLNRSSEESVMIKSNSETERPPMLGPEAPSSRTVKRSCELNVPSLIRMKPLDPL